MRRRFCRRIYEATRDINVTRAAVGHRWIQTTQLYLGLADEAAAAAILAVGRVDRNGPRATLAGRAG
jgi:hypothetical protein